MMQWIWRSAPGLIVLVAFVLPLLFWVTLALGEDGAHVHLSLPTLFAALAETLLYSAIVALCCTLLGTGTAILWYLEGRFARGLITVSMAGALTTGLILRNYGWISFLSLPGPRSYLPILYTPVATVIVMVVALTAVPFFVARLSLESTAQVMIEAARVLGATETRILTQILLRRIRPQIMGAAGLVFAAAMSYFITPRMLGGNKAPFIGNLIVSVLDNNGDFQAASWAAMFLLMSMLVIAAGVWAGVTYLRRLRRKARRSGQ
jgi:ABC-type spermidine/putrescine transport system permease subunit I